MRCAAVFILVAVANIQLLLPMLQPFRLGALTTVGSIFLLLQSRGRARRGAAVLDVSTRLALGLLVWATLSIPFALNRGLAFKAVTDEFLQTVLLLVVIVSSVRGFKDVERLMFVHLTGVVCYCLYVVLTLRVASQAARLEDIAGNYDPNDFAAFAATGAPIAVYFMSHLHSLWRRVFAGAGLGLIAASSVISGSRGGLVALLACALYLLFFGRTILLRWRVMSVIVGAGVILATATDGYWSRMSTLLAVEDDYNVTDEVGRVQIWKRGMVYALTHPVIGVGISNFGWAEGTISPHAKRQEYGVGVKYLAPHNSFVQVLAELGFPGFIMWVGALIFAFRGVRRTRVRLERAVARVSPMAEALTGTLLVTLVGIFFLSFAYSSLLFAMLALAVGFGKIGRLYDTTLRRS